MNIYIKKPKLFSITQLNTINKLPQLKGEEEQYYYKIYFPDGDYDSLLVQFTGYTFRFSLFKESIQCIFGHTFNNFYNLPIEKTDKMNNNTYINYYGVVSSDAYINFVPRNEYIYTKYYFSSFKFNMTVKQIGDTNKLNIKLNSYSYFYNQKPIQYYLLLGEKNDLLLIYSILNETKSNKNVLKVLDDNGEKEIFECDFEIDDDLITDYNVLTIFSVFKENNLVDDDKKESIVLNYKRKDNDDDDNNNALLIILIVIGAVLLVIIIIIIIYCRRRKNNNSRDLSEKIVENDLKPIY